MAPRQRVEFPFKGRSDGSAKGDQPSGTTQAAKNVVGWVPGTEQMQGGQRAGLSPFLDDTVDPDPLVDNNPPLSALDTPIQHGITVSYDRAAFDYVQLGKVLTSLPDDDDLGADSDWEFTSPDGTETFRVRADLERGTYWLSDGLITKRNALGEDLFHVPLPLTQIQTTARVLELDLAGNVYVAGSSNDDTALSSVFKFVPREDDKGMDLAWEVGIEAVEIAALAFEFGRLLIGANSSPDDRQSIVYGLDDLESSTPSLSPGLESPYPIGDFAAGPSGSYVTFPPSEDRGPAGFGDGFTDSQIDATPHDLDDSEERLHAWLDAEETGQYSDSQHVNIWADRRFVDTAATTVLDDTQRRFRVKVFTVYDDDHDGVHEGALAPRYSSSAGHSGPGLVFNATEGNVEDDTSIYLDNGSAMYSSSPDTGGAFPLRADKDTALGKLPMARGIWPLTVSHKFCMTIMARWRAGWPPSVVWSSGFTTEGDITNVPFATHDFIAIVINFDAAAAIAANGTTLKAGWLLADQYQEDGGVALIRNNVIIAYESATKTAGSDETRMALITLVQNDSSTANSYLRVNDTLAIKASDGTTNPFTLDDTHISTNQELLGTRVYHEGTPVGPLEAVMDTLGILPNFDAFTGSLHEIVTFFGTGSAGVHNVDITTADYSLVEGYLAWKWGVAASVLTGSHAWTASPPTSGTGFTGSLEDDTSKALRSREGILARLKSNLEGYQWAISGSGLGHGVAADDEDGVICVGPRSAPVDVGIDNEIGPQGRIILKGIDRGLQFEWPEPATGTATLTDTPIDGSTFTLLDGVNSETYEFTAGTPAGNNIKIDLAGGAVSIADRVSVAVTTSLLVNPTTGVDIFCDRDLRLVGYPQKIRFYSRLKPDGTARAITTTLMTSSPDEEFRVDAGMTGPGIAPTNTWDRRVARGDGLTNPSVQMDTDVDENVYIPLATDTKTNHIVKYSKRGQVGDFLGTAEEVWTHKIDGAASTFQAHAVAIDVREEDLFPATGPGHVWVATSNIDATGAQSTTEETQRKITTVRSTVRNGLARELAILAVSGGGLYKITRGSTAGGSPGSADLVASGQGSNLFQSDSIWVQAAPLFGEVFYVDAGVYKVYNLKKDTIRDWTVVGSGEMPEGARLVAAYRGRMVLARAKSDPHNLHASAQGDPYNWNLAAPTDDFTRAFSGSQLETARSPDLINALAPFFDDRLVLGGDRTISIFSGDLSELGRADLFTDATGMAFGSTHALDPEGFIYFYGSRGGVWAMSPAAEGRSSPPVELTDQTIAAELGKLDLEVYRPHLVWDQDQRSLYVYVVRRDAGTVAQIVQQWMFEKRSKAWWPVTIDAAGKNPSAAWLSDGDLPGDRVHVIGCEDGRLRFWNPSSVWDDGTKIDSSVLIGPLVSQDAGFEAKLTSLEITLAEGAVRYEVFASDSPAKLGPVRASGRVTEGFSGSLRHKIRGGTLWIRLYNSSEAETWRLESVFADLYAGGRRRIR